MPRSVPCPTCGQVFLPSGLRFHQKTCAQRQAHTITACPYCQMEMPQMSLDGHVATCKVARRAGEGRRRAAAAGGAGRGGAPGGATTGQIFAEETLADGRSRCGFCGRCFAGSDRTHTHRAICGSLRQARPAGVGGIQTQLPTRIYNSAAARTTHSGSFDRQRQRLFIPRGSAESQGLLVRCAGVARKIGSRATATLAPWQVLGVDRRACKDEVRAAYRQLAMQWHPDRHPDDRKAEAEARFKAVNEAHEVMMRPRRLARGASRRPRLALVAPDSWRGKSRDLQCAMRAGRGVRQPCQQQRPQRGNPAGARGRPAAHTAKAASPLSPKASALSPLSPGDRVAIHGLSAAGAYLNGTSGVVRACDAESGRWHVELASGGLKAIRSENLRVSGVPCVSGAQASRPASCSSGAVRPGDRVRLGGLSGARHLNGVNGVLQSFDRDAQRWIVALEGPDPGELKAVRVENLQPLLGAAPAPAVEASAAQAPPRPAPTRPSPVKAAPSLFAKSSSASPAFAEATLRRPGGGPLAHSPGSTLKPAMDRSAARGTWRAAASAGGR